MCVHITTQLTSQCTSQLTSQHITPLHTTSQHNTAWHDTIPLYVARHAHHATTQHDMTQHGTTYTTYTAYTTWHDTTRANDGYNDRILERDADTRMRSDTRRHDIHRWYRWHHPSPRTSAHLIGVASRMTRAALSMIRCHGFDLSIAIYSEPSVYTVYHTNNTETHHITETHWNWNRNINTYKYKYRCSHIHKIHIRTIRIYICLNCCSFCFTSHPITSHAHAHAHAHAQTYTHIHSPIWLYWKLSRYVWYACNVCMIFIPVISGRIGYGGMWSVVFAYGCDVRYDCNVVMAWFNCVRVVIDDGDK